MDYFLGIETSCDDTSVALIERPRTSEALPKVLFHETYDQQKMLEQWGGVVPEMASRNHLEKLIPLLKEGVDSQSIEGLEKKIKGIAVTTRPGLLGPLLTGLHAARNMSMLWQVPIIPVNHLYAHLEAIFLSENIPYPYFGILVSGGHTLFLLMKSETEHEILGRSLDDAAGEAFDKGARLMGLSGGGKTIDDLAKTGKTNAFAFPKVLRERKDADMSFSGLKTSLRVLLDQQPGLAQDQARMPDLCASYQMAVVDHLLDKTHMAYSKLNKKIPIVLGGGVAMNSLLRSRLRQEFQNVAPRIALVRPEYCTDNGAMIANLGMRMWQKMPETFKFPECLLFDSSSRFIGKNGETVA